MACNSKSRSPLPSHQVEMHQRVPADQATCGFPGLLKGTKTLGCVLITDRGFCRDLAQKYSEKGILSPREWCEAHKVLFLWPFNEDDDVGLLYNPVEHRLVMVPKEEAKVRHIIIIGIFVQCLYDTTQITKISPIRVQLRTGPVM